MKAQIVGMIEAQYAYATDRDDVDALRRVAKRARKYAGKLTEQARYTDAAHLRRVADRAETDRYLITRF